MYSILLLLFQIQIAIAAVQYIKNAIFYTNDFTDENLTNTRNKLASVVDELFQKTELEARAGAKIVFWSELNGAILKQDEEAVLRQAARLNVHV